MYVLWKGSPPLLGELRPLLLAPSFLEGDDGQCRGREQQTRVCSGPTRWRNLDLTCTSFGAHWRNMRRLFHLLGRRSGALALSTRVIGPLSLGGTGGTPCLPGRSS